MFRIFLAYRIVQAKLRTNISIIFGFILHLCSWNFGQVYQQAWGIWKILRFGETERESVLIFQLINLLRLGSTKIDWRLIRNSNATRI